MVLCRNHRVQGQPAAVKVFNFNAPSFDIPVSQKSFFKGDKVQLKWNDEGSNLIVLAQTEVDKSGKSYYGETTLYLLSANGGFDSRIDLGASFIVTSRSMLLIFSRQRGPNTRRDMVPKIPRIRCYIRLYACEDDHLQLKSCRHSQFCPWPSQHNHLFTSWQICSCCWLWKSSWPNGYLRPRKGLSEDVHNRGEQCECM